MISFYLADNQKYDILKIGNNIWRAEPHLYFSIREYLCLRVL